MNLATHKLHIQGMHCKSCVLFIHEIVSKVEGIDKIDISLTQQTIEYNCDENTSPEQIITLLNPLIEEYWYTLHSTPPVKKISWWEYVLALIMSVVLMYGFTQLQQLGLWDILDGSHRTYWTSFIIWLIASVSSCLAVVGSVVLALGTVYSQSISFRPHLLFHIGRMAGFFILGGLLGAVGSVFQLSGTISTVLNMIISVVLCVLGLNLLWVIRWSATLWWWVFTYFSKKSNGSWWALIIGIATFFLPCGFTQSMQIYTLSTGSFLVGGLTMLSFALGTLPILLLLSITGKSIQKSSSSGLLFKTIGIILVVLAIYNLINSLVVLGIMRPIFI